MEGVEKKDLELDDGDRLERSNKDVVLVGDSQAPNQVSTIRIDDRVEAKIAGWNKYYSGKITKTNSDGTFDIRFDDGDRKRE